MSQVLGPTSPSTVSWWRCWNALTTRSVFGAELAVDVQRLAPEHGVPALGQGVEPGLDLPDGAAGRPEPDDRAREARGTGRLDDVGPGEVGPDEVDHMAPVADLAGDHAAVALAAWAAAAGVA
ncbi:MAG TPA: hypothetical protein VFS70_01785, partial [Actinomycetota bacterium]|nr:hypothetical protein [Actinomycetota bacterium]